MTLAVARRPGRGPGWVGVAPLVALAAVGAGVVLGWGGVDVAASVHRILEYRRYGFTLWDGSWYGGQWTLDYSVVFAPVAATLGLHALGLAAAALAALSFERIVTAHFGRTARLGTVLFALGIAIQTAIGQFPYLSGEALGLAAVWAATRARWPLAWALAVASALLSPLAGAFVALAAAAWLLTGWRDRPQARSVAIAAVGAAALAPTAVTTVLFPGEGVMPFSATDCFWDVVIAAVLFAVCGRRERTLRLGLVLYAVLLVGSFAVASPLGGNAGRLEDCMALPLAAVLLWPRRRIVLAVIGVPLLLSAWTPAWGAVTAAPSRPSSHRAFYAPLDAWLARSDPAGRDGRVEVVPTADHWESVWVAAVVPLARGWERQSDVSENPIFYTPGRLTARTYRAWLLANGVAYVALPTGPLDSAGVAEAALVVHGVPGLRPAWSDRNWRVWSVTGSPGLVTGPAVVRSVTDDEVQLSATRAASLLVRVSWDGNWVVSSGSACATGAGRWTRVVARHPGDITLSVAVRPPTSSCAAGRRRA